VNEIVVWHYTASTSLANEIIIGQYTARTRQANGLVVLQYTAWTALANEIIVGNILHRQGKPVITSLGIILHGQCWRMKSLLGQASYHIVRRYTAWTVLANEIVVGNYSVRF
jgi:hypothetical protein